MTGRHTLTSAFCVAALAASFLLPCAAWDFSATVVDGNGAPLADAVVVLKPASAVAVPPLDPTFRGAVGQKDKAFAPRVLAVRTGTVVGFPNRDPILHHVYSFSPTKSFELELYGAREVPEITFDQAGIVALACNIHDGMRGHIYVTDSPWFAVSAADGAVHIAQLPDVDFDIEVWHERARSAPAPVHVAAGAAPPQLVIAVRAAPMSELAPHEAGEY